MLSKRDLRMLVRRFIVKTLGFCPAGLAEIPKRIDESATALGNSCSAPDMRGWVAGIPRGRGGARDPPPKIRLCLFSHNTLKQKAPPKLGRE